MTRSMVPMNVTWLWLQITIVASQDTSAVADKISSIFGKYIFKRPREPHSDMRFFFCARIRCLAQKAKVKCHKKQKRNATKNQNEMPQKAKANCHKKQKQIATKNKNYLAVSFILSIFAHKIV